MLYLIGGTVGVSPLSGRLRLPELCNALVNLYEGHPLIRTSLSFLNLPAAANLYRRLVLSTRMISTGMAEHSLRAESEEAPA